MIIGRPGSAQAVGVDARAQLRRRLDLQGLLKSAAMARLSGARRVDRIRDGARCASARRAWFYSETAAVPAGAHIIQKNLSVLPVLGVAPPPPCRFPFRVPASAVADDVSPLRASRGAGGFVLINPGAAWPNKRWAPDRFGALAARIRAIVMGCRRSCCGGAAKRALADAVVAASQGAAHARAADDARRSAGARRRARR